MFKRSVFEKGALGLALFTTVGQGLAQQPQYTVQSGASSASRQNDRISFEGLRILVEADSYDKLFKYPKEQLPQLKEAALQRLAVDQINLVQYREEKAKEDAENARDKAFRKDHPNYPEKPQLPSLTYEGGDLELSHEVDVDLKFVKAIMVVSTQTIPSDSDIKKLALSSYTGGKRPPPATKTPSPKTTTVEPK